jgi:hypothetical protein
MAHSDCTVTTMICRNGESKAERRRSTARMLALIWACGWVFFAVLGVGDQGFSRQGVLILIFCFLVFLGSAVIPRLWERIGGIILLIEGLIILVGYLFFLRDRYPIFAIIIVVLALAMPPLVAGFLFLAAGWRRSRTSGTPQESS